MRRDDSIPRVRAVFRRMRKFAVTRARRAPPAVSRPFPRRGSVCARRVAHRGRILSMSGQSSAAARGACLSMMRSIEH
ncbi:hypothetical protein AQ731_26245 [Burkholderia pseudomallei]|nr:hypothetical protein A7U59_29355 [Burkholderia pseudomallei]PNX06707.1 hypothetical protein CF649_00665 [Burkholderia sp. 136(2017)]PNX15419.1 hypothetical protein CF650_12665 [Burkholderia sp. 129]PNX33945.1 hypothetical protein CF647_00575 [Burkholderia sp. 117]PNX42428.1 hypothetical protein CF648_00665 [Burkholderia sp. 137]